MYLLYLPVFFTYLCILKIEDRTPSLPKRLSFSGIERLPGVKINCYDKGYNCYHY